MIQTNKTPAGKAGASRDKLGGTSHFLFIAAAVRLQGLVNGLTKYPDLPIILQAAFVRGGANG